MATHKSALKRHRQSLDRRERNRVIKGGLRKSVRRTRMAVADGDLETARQSLQETISHLDRAAKKGIIHPNNAARRKSRLTKLVNQAAES